MDHADNGYSLLILDHNPETRAVVEPLAASLHLRVRAESAREKGLAMLQREKVTAVLLALPPVNGNDLQLLESVVRLAPTSIVMVLLDSVSVETAVEIMKKGARELFTRPIDPKRLASALAQALEKTRRLSKVPVLPLELDQERFTAIADALPYGLLVCDAESRIVFFNSAFERLLGQLPHPVLQRPLADYIDDERLNHLVCAAPRQANAGSAANNALEICLGGRELTVRVRPLAGDQTNGKAGSIVTLMDVTELKALERLQNGFVSRVSHELRSPLTTIHEQLDFVLRDAAGALPDPKQHLLSRAREKTRGLLDLIGDLLDLARLEAGTVCAVPAAVDVIDVLENLIGFMQTRAIGKRLCLELEHAGRPLWVRAEPPVLESVFSNLLTNALNYTPDGGRIRVTAARDGDWAKVRVADTGIGIDECHLGKIFERFYRIRNDRTRHVIGTGLGLPITKGLVESLGGRIEVESRPGSGTVFSVTLPFAE